MHRQSQPMNQLRMADCARQHPMRQRERRADGPKRTVGANSTCNHAEHLRRAHRGIAMGQGIAARDPSVLSALLGNLDHAMRRQPSCSDAYCNCPYGRRLFGGGPHHNHIARPQRRRHAAAGHPDADRALPAQQFRRQLATGPLVSLAGVQRTCTRSGVFPVKPAGALRAADLAARQRHRFEHLLLTVRGLLIRLARRVFTAAMLALLRFVHRQSTRLHFSCHRPR